MTKLWYDQDVKITCDLPLIEYCALDLVSLPYSLLVRDHVEIEVKRESLGNLVTLDPQEEKDLLVMMDLKEIR